MTVIQKTCQSYASRSKLGLAITTSHGVYVLPPVQQQYAHE